MKLVLRVAPRGSVGVALRCMMAQRHEEEWQKKVEETVKEYLAQEREKEKEGATAARRKRLMDMMERAERAKRLMREERARGRGECAVRAG
jgi:hypothetical protein